MDESTTKTTRHFTPCASLAAIGVKLKQLDLFDPIRQQVRIAQKTVKHSPIDKLYDAFIAMLAGAHGLVEINSRLRSDLVHLSPALYAHINRYGKYHFEATRTLEQQPRRPLRQPSVLNA